MNETLHGLMEVYRITVSRLESDLEVAESDLRAQNWALDELRGKLDSAVIERDKNAAVIEEQRLRAIKQQNVIESLRIELQNAREELTQLKDLGL